MGNCVGGELVAPVWVSLEHCDPLLATCWRMASRHVWCLWPRRAQALRMPARMKWVVPWNYRGALSLWLAISSTSRPRSPLFFSPPYPCPKHQQEACVVESVFLSSFGHSDTLELSGKASRPLATPWPRPVGVHSPGVVCMRSEMGVLS